MGIQKDYVLGLDLGSASIGWALIEMGDGGPRGILRAGVRVFDPGVDGDLESGQEESKNKTRREARGHRRQLRRRSGRQRELFELLQAKGLLPPAPEEVREDRSLARHSVLNRLDQELWEKWRPRLEALGVPSPEHVLIYALRARALEEALTPHELGRVFYHLSQRRGFKSNRKSAPKQDEKPGEVKQAISDLAQAVQESGAPTLGAYFSRVSPTQTKIRRRWTAREMFVHEFGAIWEAQAPHHPGLLTEDLKKQVYHLLYYQRPLREQEHLIGKCELEPGEQRAPKCTLAAQRFRYLQRVNDLELELDSGEIRRLTDDERKKVIELLEEDDQTFAAMRKALGFKGKLTRFNLERGGEKKLPGNRTAKRMREIFGERWSTFSPEQQEEIVAVWREAEDPEDAMRTARERWHLGEEQARKFAEPGEPDYVNFSLKALRHLLPLLEQGKRLQEAIKEKYPERFEAGAICDYLPPVQDVRNPAVQRALTELRHLVNAVVDAYGKPAAIRVELARDLKKPRDERNRISKENRERQKQRSAARERILNEAGIPNPTRADIEKYMLAEECGWICPYTGRSISMESLFVSPQFEIEHILPLSRFPDNSFANKTLCHISANREKTGRTPYEAFHADEEAWRKILERVKRFGSPGKLRRFQMKPEDTEPAKMLEEFTARQLQDTRYASKMAAQYLGLLYGGRDEDGKRKVFASSGQVTSTLRAVWGLNRVLGLDGEKNRGDHRHHAVDAIVIGVTDESTIKRMAEQASRAPVIEPGKPDRPFRKLQQPWPDFVDSVRPHIESLVVSHRPQHRLRGELHEETLYGRPYQANGKTYTHVRKEVARLSANEIEAIVDPAVRRAVQAKLAAFDGNLKKMQSAVATDPPLLPGKDSRMTPIRKVRLRRSGTPIKLSDGPRERHILTGNNHHVEIVAELDEKDREIRWDGIVVTLLEAMERKRARLPIVQRQFQDSSGTRLAFRFSLMGKDIVEMDGDDGNRDLYVVRKISEYSTGTVIVGFVRVNDARLTKEMTKDDMQIIVPETMRKRNCKKVTIDSLGYVHEAND